jgi:hypothetical protein
MNLGSGALSDLPSSIKEAVSASIASERDVYAEGFKQ